MRLVCHALVQRLSDEALNEATLCLSGLFDIQGSLSSEAGSRMSGHWLSAGIKGLIRKRIDALAQGAYSDEAASTLKNIRDQLASGLAYADHGMGILAERLELGDLALADQDAVHQVAGAIAWHVADDAALACDPDQHAE